MSVEQYFKKHPGATEVWQVGEDLYHFRYRASAAAHSQRSGLPLQLVKRKSVEKAQTGNLPKKEE